MLLLHSAAHALYESVDVEEASLLLRSQEYLRGLYVRLVHCERVLIACSLSLPIQAAAAALTWVRKTIRPRSLMFDPFHTFIQCRGLLEDESEID